MIVMTSSDSGMGSGMASGNDASARACSTVKLLQTPSWIGVGSESRAAAPDSGEAALSFVEPKLQAPATHSDSATTIIEMVLMHG